MTQAHISLGSSAHHEAKALEQSTGPELTEITIRETFTGNIAGESFVHALQLRRSDGSASQVSMQRFLGTLGGRKGSFVLQGSGIVENGKIKAAWRIVLDSGTEDLVDVQGGFEGEFGKGSKATLDYWFP